MSYESDRREIKQAFEEGMDFLFKTMFTETVWLYPLDEEHTTQNVYNEAAKKFYLAPYSLTAKVVPAREQGEETVQTVQQSVTITIPNAQLVEKNIPHTTAADLDLLAKCAVYYRGLVFLVDRVEPRTHVADTFLFYTMYATTRDKNMFDEYFLPDPVTGEWLTPNTPIWRNTNE